MHDKLALLILLLEAPHVPAPYKQIVDPRHVVGYHVTIDGSPGHVCKHLPSQLPLPSSSNVQLSKGLQFWGLRSNRTKMHMVYLVLLVGTRG